MGGGRIRTERTKWGFEQSATFHHADRYHEDVEELCFSSPFMNLTNSLTAESEVLQFLLLGDQNAGKSTFLHAFCDIGDENFTQMTSFVPMLRSSFVNARLLHPAENESQGEFLTRARDEGPFLDSDLARGAVLLTSDDFIFLCKEFGLSQFEHALNLRPRNPQVFDPFAPPKSENGISEDTAGRKHASEETLDGNAPVVVLKESTRYVTIHFLEFGGDHLDRLMWAACPDQLSTTAKRISQNVAHVAAGLENPTTIPPATNSTDDVKSAEQVFSEHLNLVLKRSFNLLSETSTAVYFINARSLFSAVSEGVKCAIDATEFGILLDRLVFLASRNHIIDLIFFCMRIPDVPEEGTTSLLDVERSWAVVTEVLVARAEAMRFPAATSAMRSLLENISTRNLAVSSDGNAPDEDEQEGNLRFRQVFADEWPAEVLEEKIKVLDSQSNHSVMKFLRVLLRDVLWSAPNLWLPLQEDVDMQSSSESERHRMKKQGDRCALPNFRGIFAGATLERSRKHMPAPAECQAMSERRVSVDTGGTEQESVDDTRRLQNRGGEIGFEKLQISVPSLVATFCRILASCASSTAGKKAAFVTSKDAHGNDEDVTQFAMQASADSFDGGVAAAVIAKLLSYAVRHREVQTAGGSHTTSSSSTAPPEVDLWMTKQLFAEFVGEEDEHCGGACHHSAGSPSLHVLSNGSSCCATGTSAVSNAGELIRQAVDDLSVVHLPSLSLVNEWPRMCRQLEVLGALVRHGGSGPFAAVEVRVATGTDEVVTFSPFSKSAHAGDTAGTAAHDSTSITAFRFPRDSESFNEVVRWLCWAAGSGHVPNGFWKRKSSSGDADQRHFEWRPESDGMGTRLARSLIRKLVAVSALAGDLAPGVPDCDSDAYGAHQVASRKAEDILHGVMQTAADLIVLWRLTAGGRVSFFSSSDGFHAGCGEIFVDMRAEVGAAFELGVKPKGQKDVWEVCVEQKEAKELTQNDTRLLLAGLSVCGRLPFCEDLKILTHPTTKT